MTYRTTGTRLPVLGNNRSSCIHVPTTTTTITHNTETSSIIFSPLTDSNSHLSTPQYPYNFLSNLRTDDKVSPAATTTDPNELLIVNPSKRLNRGSKVIDSKLPNDRIGPSISPTKETRAPRLASVDRRLDEDSFHIISMIGEGGFSRVYKGYYAPLERTVAIKVVARVGLPRAGLDWLWSERDIGTLIHVSQCYSDDPCHRLSSVSPIIGSFVTDTHFVFVMDWAAGDLGSLELPVPEDVARVYLAQI
ncbi:hypothetical protein FRC19_000706, partial [Serendipita sp. 401]